MLPEISSRLPATWVFRSSVWACSINRFFPTNDNPEREPVGWALGDGREHGDNSSWDAAEAEALYSIIEQEVVPEFYTRDEKGIPTAWVARIRESMARLTPLFSANRSVTQYTEQYYIPAATAYSRRAAEKGAMGKAIAVWRHTLEQKWANLRFGEVAAEPKGEEHMFFGSGLPERS